MGGSYFRGNMHALEPRSNEQPSLRNASRSWQRLGSAPQAYFNGYALWTYLTTPFLLKMHGVDVHEVEPWPGGKEVWRRLRARFPAHLAPHIHVQDFFFNLISCSGVPQTISKAGNPSKETGSWADPKGVTARRGMAHTALQARRKNWASLVLVNSRHFDTCRRVIEGSSSQSVRRQAATSESVVIIILLTVSRHRSVLAHALLWFSRVIYDAQRARPLKRTDSGYTSTEQSEQRRVLRRSAHSAGFGMGLKKLGFKSGCAISEKINGDFRRKKRLNNVCSKLSVRKVTREMPAMHRRQGSQIPGL